jgi:hypothetical protein
MRFVCLIYFDPKVVFGGSAEAKAVLDAVRPHDEALRSQAQLVASEALTLPAEAVTVRVRGGKSFATDGPVMETKEVLAGFVLVEAADRSEAVRIAGEMPFAKLGAVEVRPVVDFSKPRPRL